MTELREQKKKKKETKSNKYTKKIQAKNVITHVCMYMYIQEAVCHKNRK